MKSYGVTIQIAVFSHGSISSICISSFWVRERNRMVYHSNETSSALHFHVILFLFISILQNEISNFCLFFTLANAASRRVKETVCCSLVDFVWFFPLSINDVQRQRRLLLNDKVTALWQTNMSFKTSWWFKVTNNRDKLWNNELWISFVGFAVLFIDSFPYLDQFINPAQW